MQRRTMATFRRITGDNPDAPRWLSYPGFVPQLGNNAESVILLIRCKDYGRLSVIYRYSLASCRVYAMIAMATAPAGEILSFTLIFRQKSFRHGKR